MKAELSKANEATEQVKAKITEVEPTLPKGLKLVNTYDRSDLIDRSIDNLKHTLLEELAEATLAGTRKDYLAELAVVPLLIIDDLGMRKLAHTAAEDLLELIMRRYERASTLLTSNRPVDDWGKLLGDTAAVTALLDRLLHHAHVLKCGPRSWRTKVHTDLQSGERVR